MRRTIHIALALAAFCACAMATAADARAMPGAPGARAAAFPLIGQGHLRWAANLRAAPSVSAARLATLPPESVVDVDAWATDSLGRAWYHRSGAVPGWIYADAVLLDRGAAPDPAALLAPLRGTGMWTTDGELRRAPASAIVAAARAAGLSHLYVEVAESSRGFYGATGLAALLPLAHRAGLSVIAWVYPYLRDLPADVALTVAAARYTAPSGDRPDGVLADVEENTAEEAVHAYGQLVRAALGPDETMAIAAAPPRSAAGRTFPYATAALSWDAIVPMDYWHARRRLYAPAEVYAYVRDSVTDIRASTRPDMPVEVLGQMFDLYAGAGGTDESPDAAEILAAAAAARATGAIGVSFFEWAHATAEEWRALTALPLLESAQGAPLDPADGHAPGVDVSPGMAGYRAPYATVTVAAANVRAAPTLTAPVIAVATDGTALALKRVSGPWEYVETPSGVTGWMRRDLGMPGTAPSLP